MTIKSHHDLEERGYRTWGTPDAFEDYIGPFYFKKMEDGSYHCAFVSEEKHLNGGGMLHGGMLMSYADFALFAIARDHLDMDGMAVTVSMNSEFISAGPVDAVIEATGEVTRATRSLIFARGRIFCGDTTVMTFSGIMKKLNKT